MGRVTAVPNIAEMIKNLNIFPLSSRNRFYQPSIHKPVDVNGFGMIGSKSITEGVERTIPEPTPRFVIHSKMRENLGSFVGADIGDGE